MFTQRLARRIALPAGKRPLSMFQNQNTVKETRAKYYSSPVVGKKTNLILFYICIIMIHFLFLIILFSIIYFPRFSNNFTRLNFRSRQPNLSQRTRRQGHVRLWYGCYSLWIWLRREWFIQYGVRDQ